jgi:hypothetical protein
MPGERPPLNWKVGAPLVWLVAQAINARWTLGAQQRKEMAGGKLLFWQSAVFEEVL